ncbi:hypothetical protein VaNZ11_005298 [Volvox africanus]|uniref:Uncharacterized protein n=1 Tax=Volvox africanus TaxID=51714 RepID=A0ABQ5RZF3_9CHLO|nr:hypothetical protein VaNZ11_005298 [Volvox africanus]
MTWFFQKEDRSTLRAELQKARDELHQNKDEFVKLLRDRESDAEAVRRMLAAHSSELTRVKATFEEQKSVSQSHLEDKAKLQLELIDHLKLLRLRDERLGLLRRDLADSEFEVDQLRVALRCTTLYTLQLEADKQAAEALIQHVCAELDRVGAVVAASLDAARGQRDIPAALSGLPPSSEAMNPAAAPLSCAASSSSHSSHRTSSCSSNSSSSTGGRNHKVACCCPNKPAEAEAEAEATIATMRDSKEVDRQQTERQRSEKSIGEDDSDTVAAAAATPAAAPLAAATTSLEMSVAAGGLLSLLDVLGRLPEQLWSVRQQLHGLIVHPKVAAAAAAKTPTSSTLNETATAGGCIGVDTAAATGSGHATETFNGCGNGGGGAPPCELATPRVPPPTVVEALLQLCGLAEGKPRRTGNETLTEYDAGIGSLTDWGHRRHAATSCAEPAVLARLMMGPRGRRDGGGGVKAVGVAAATASPPASEPLTPHQRPDVLAGLSEALMGWGPADGGIRNAILVQGRRMAGAASPSPALSLLSSPTRCSSVYMPTSPAPSPTGAAKAPSCLMAVAPPCGETKKSGHLGGTGLQASTQPQGCGGAGTHNAAVTATGAAAAGSTAAGAGAAAATAVASAVLDSVPPRNVPSSHPQTESYQRQEGQEGLTESHPQLRQQSAGNEQGHLYVRDLDSELGSLRLTNEALQRQVAELQRQNDLLQLRQLGGGSEGCGDGGFSGGGVLGSGFGGPLVSELFRAPPHQQLHSPHPLPSHAFGSSPGGRKAAAAAAADRQQHAISAAAAATTSPYNSPLSAPYYYGSLPPGQQSPTAGFAAAVTRAPAVVILPRGSVAVTDPGPTPPRPGRPEAMSHQTLRSTNGTCKTLRTRNSFASGAAHNQTATAAGPYAGGAPTSARNQQGVLGQEVVLSRRDGNHHPDGDGAAMTLNAGKQHDSSSGGSVPPPAPPASAAATLVAAPLPLSGALAAQVPAPPGVDPALWELELLVACSKEAAAGLVE